MKETSGAKKAEGFIEKQEPATPDNIQLLHKYDFIITFTQGETPISQFINSSLSNIVKNTTSASNYISTIMNMIKAYI